MVRVPCILVTIALILSAALAVPRPGYDERYPMYHVHTHLDEMGEYIPQTGSAAHKAAEASHFRKMYLTRLSRTRTKRDALKGALRGKEATVDAEDAVNRGKLTARLLAAA